jgi:putative ABC transport system permease protein
MHIQPILAALRRHRTSTFLIGMEIALACAILCNAIFLVDNRLHMMQLGSGVDEDRLVVLSLDGVDDGMATDLVPRLRSALAGIGGVESVAVTNAVPFTAQAGENGFRLLADDMHFNNEGHFYIGDAAYSKTLGLRLVAGRWLNPDEYAPIGQFLPTSHAIMVSRDYARELWNGADPLGKMIYTEGAYRVVGVYDNLLRPNPTADAITNTFLLGGVAGRALASTYVLRTAPAQRDRVLREAEQAVRKVAPSLVIDRTYTGSLTTLRHAYFANDRAMAGMLLGVIAALLLVTALGIVGLASFWVQQRRRQIGIRRAIGARRIDILRYFQIENFLIVSAGTALGMVMAYGLNLLLMTHYELPRLPLYYLPVGALALWLLGQLAVLGPALRAAAVPPVVATRSV